MSDASGMLIIDLHGMDALLVSEERLYAWRVSKVNSEPSTRGDKASMNKSTAISLILLALPLLGLAAPAGWQLRAGSSLWRDDAGV